MPIPSSPSYNVRPDAPDFRDRMYNPTLSILHHRYNNEPFVEDSMRRNIKNQGNTKACTGYALASMIERLIVNAQNIPGYPVEAELCLASTLFACRDSLNFPLDIPVISAQYIQRQETHT